jgi:hypothetical protein
MSELLFSFFFFYFIALGTVFIIDEIIPGKERNSGVTYSELNITEVSAMQVLASKLLIIPEQINNIKKYIMKK